MKTGILIAVLLTINSISYGQDVNYQYFDKNWNTSSKKSAFFIREISIINDTLYQITETNKFGRVLMTGSFRSLNPLVENGPFMFFTKTCGFDTIKGNYRNGDMIGNWSYKNANNEPIIINYDFTLKECLNYEGNQFDQNNYYVIVEKMPTFNGGDINTFREFITKTLIFPPMACHRKFSGTVFVIFTVNAGGEVCNISISKSSFNKDLDREILRALSISPKWEPGSQNGKNVNVRINLPFVFKLQ